MIQALCRALTAYVESSDEYLCVQTERQYKEGVPLHLSRECKLEHRHVLTAPSRVLTPSPGLLGGEGGRQRSQEGGVHSLPVGARLSKIDPPVT